MKVSIEVKDLLNNELGRIDDLKRDIEFNHIKQFKNPVISLGDIYLHFDNHDELAELGKLLTAYAETGKRLTGK